MFRKLISISTSLFILLGATQTANAGLILYSDRESFEEAVTGNLSFEGFNSSDTLNEDLTVNKSRFRSTTSLVSEGDKALSISENSVLTVSFDHDVFAFGFDVLVYTASPTQVPTPQTFVLFLLAIGGMFLTTRLNKN